LFAAYFNEMINIDNNKFIFSDERKYRIKRHLLFWGFWGFWFGMVRELNPSYLKLHGHFPNFFKTMAEAFLFLLPQAVLVYPLLYFILPRYFFNGKYIKASLWIFVFLFLTITVSAAFLIYIPWHKVAWITSQTKLFEGTTNLGKLSMAYLSALQGSLTAGALAIGFKMFKYYYLKNLRNQQLQKENTESQLQLLKAQVHPHFLFNTLNNIYSQTQTESPKGSKMIMGLSDMLRYILYEGQKPLVPLKQELLMIAEYINLEKIRYGNKLDVHVLTPDKTDDLYIAPLLLLPFIENCFKHGTSNMLQNPWINLTVELKDTILVMKLMNGKTPLNGNIHEKEGIGINNVSQRLNLLYKDKFDLQIREDEEVFVVDLKVELIKIKNKEQDDAPVQPQPELVYG
jgi:two-component system, LytTR family, sensor kinase